MINNYDDIINMERPLSKRNKMSIDDRAAQFASFAALAGYDDAVIETGRYVNKRIELDEESYNILDTNFHEIKINVKNHPLVNITYFIKDSFKDGGQYISDRQRVNKIDEDRHLLILQDETVIDIDDIFYIEQTND